MATWAWSEVKGYEIKSVKSDGYICVPCGYSDCSQFFDLMGRIRILSFEVKEYSG